MTITHSKLSAIACLAMVVGLMGHSQADAQRVKVSITNNAPSNGVFLTPVWVGFHDGSFDSYNGGLSSQVGLERLAEDGNNSVIDQDFRGGYTYVDNSGGTPVSARVLTSQTTGRVSSLGIGSPSGPPPLQPGETVSQTFTLSNDGSNDYFSYASMVLPSNDYYVANGDPLAHDISSVIEGGGPIVFNIGLPGSINDAGTEVNDFATAAPGGPNLPGLFPGRNLPNGQSGPDTGADQNGVNANVANAFAGFLNSTGVDLSGFDFNNANLYSNGIATVTISAVPEPGSLSLLATAACCGLLRRRR